ncbi:MAG: DUF4062 domain-containing protein, partial [Verrucomicrobiales bacterium]|nr:DUF4062 domain-containing protein [Verrucomicrobiales bacterium]
MKPTEKVNLFLSAVSAEFRPHREALAEQLRKHHFVREQADFTQGPGTLLEKLEAYIRDECHAVIFLVGDHFGAEPPTHEAAPALASRRDLNAGRYSYTQWEYLFAVRHNKARFVFTPAADSAPLPGHDPAPEDTDLQTLQHSFVDTHILNQGKDRTPFHSLDDLKDQVRALKLEALAYARYHQFPLETANPYVGLRRFEERDKANFHGRTGLLADLFPQVEVEPLLLVTGHSGSGKSSALRAGLIPLWRKAYGEKAHVILFSPNDDPWEGLYIGLVASGIDPIDCSWVRAGHPDVFAELAVRLPDLRDHHILMVIDQFEELFTRVPDTEDARNRVNQFVVALVSAHRRPDSALRIVLAMRDDFYGNLERHRTLCDVLDGENRTRRIMRPTESEMRAIIEAPAASHGVGFEGELVERIVREVRGQHQGLDQERRALLPLLQFTLQELWDYEVTTDSIEDRVLNVVSYEAIGGFSGALKKRTDAFYQALGEEEQSGVQRIFLQLVQFSEADIPVSRRVSRAALEKSVDPGLLDQLIGRQRLLIAGDADPDAENTDSSVELAHEALIDGWDQFRDWIRENQQAIRLHRRLEDDAASWAGNVVGRGEEVTGAEKNASLPPPLPKHRSSSADLWRGTHLALAEDALARGEFDRIGGLSDQAQEFLSASRQAVEDEIENLKTLVTRAEAGEADALRGRKTSQRRAAVAMVFALLASVGLGGAGWFGWEAKKQEKKAEAEANRAIEQETIAITQKERAETARGAADRVINTMLYDLGDELEKRGLHTLRAEINEEAQQYFLAFPKEEEADDQLRERVVLLQRRADNLLNLGRADEALLAAEEAVSLAEQLVSRAPEQIDRLRSLAISHQYLGNVKTSLEGPASGLLHYEKSIEKMQKLYDEEPSAANARSLAISHSKLGNVKTSLEGPAPGLLHYEKYNEKMQKLYAEEPSAANARLLAISHEKLGNVKTSLESPASGLLHYEKDMELTQKLYDEEPSAANARSLAISHEKLGNVKTSLESPASGLLHYEKDMELTQKLYAEEPSAENARSLAISHEKLGNVKTSLEGSAAGLLHYEKNMELTQKLYDEEPSAANAR